MINTLFDTYVTFAPKVDAKDDKLRTISLGLALVSSKWRKQVEALRQETDPTRRKALKEGLPCFTPGGTFRHIGKDGLTNPSGYLCADLDYKLEKGINASLEDYDLKAAVSRLPYVAYCGKSCGGKGYFLIIRIADPKKYKDYYRALQADFKAGGLTLDSACSNIAFKRFVSWDESPYINTAALSYSYTLPEREYTTREVMGRALSDDETRAEVEGIIKHCEENKIDITGDYSEWVRILAALAGQFGQQGEEFAHRISSLYQGYSEEETRKKYKSFLNQPTRAGIGTFFYIARQEIGKHDFDNIPCAYESI